MNNCKLESGFFAESKGFFLRLTLANLSCHSNIQLLWAKLLRLTEILLSTKLATSLLIDLFFRCFYGILKFSQTFQKFQSLLLRNTSSFVKSQYLLCQPFCLKTTATCLGIVDFSFRTKPWLMVTHLCFISAWNLSQFKGFVCPPVFWGLTTSSWWD